MALGNNTTKSRGTRTTAQVLEDQSKQAELDRERNNKQTEVIVSAVNEALYADNREVNEMLTRAAQFGELLDNDPTYAADATAIAAAKEVDDYKVIAFLKHIDNVLDDDKRALLPWPGRSKAEAEAKRAKGSNQLILFDKIKESGGRGGNETFYGSMIKHTKLGKEAVDAIEALDKEIAQSKVEPTKARMFANIEADMRRAKTKLNNLLSALRNAAQVRLMIEDMKLRCPSVIVEWIREPIGEDVEIPHDADLTMLNVKEAGDVVHSPLCLNLWTKPQNPQLMAQAMAKAKRYSIGSFKRFKVDKAIEIAKRDQRSRVTLDDLISSAKAAPSQPTGGAKTPTVSTARDCKSLTDVIANVDAIMNYERGDGPAAEQLKHIEFKSLASGSDETLWSMYQFKIKLDALFADSALTERAIKFNAKAA